MSVNAVPKFKPGLKTALSTKSKLSAVPKFNSKTSDTASAGSTTSSSSSSNSAKNSAVSALTNNNATRSTIFSTGKYAQYGNFVEGMRNVNPSDYTMHNVDVNLDASIASGFAPTPRSVRRDINRLNKDLQRYINAMNVNNRSRSNGMDAMAMLNQIGSLAGDVTKAVISTKASNSSSVIGKSAGNTASAVKTGSEVGNVLGDLASAKSSKEIETGLATVDGQITSKTKLSEGYEAQIASDSQAKTEAEGKLGEIKTNITDTNTQIRGIDAQLPRLEAQLAAAQTSGGNTASIQQQIDNLNNQKEQLQQKLADLQKQQENTETEITNLDQSIKTNTASKEKVDGEISSLNQAKNEYTAKQTKFENSESKDLRDMNSRLTKLAQKLGKETDENKRQEMIQEYKNVASTYNALVDNTTVTGFQRVAEEPVLVNGAEMLASAEI